MGWLQGLSVDAQTAFWTIAVGCLCSVMCALLGVWLVLQRVSMIGDAISHSVLPGLVVTFIFFGTKAPLPMFIGAAVAGLATVFLTRAISGFSGVRDDASMGVVFTVLFALGVILITRYARQVDLDPGCVLYGLIEFVALDTFPVAIAGQVVEVPKAVQTLGPALLLTACFLFVLRKELLVMAFDPALAKALGKRPSLLYYLLMSMVAIATVASFEAVGSILVIAMLIGPAASAQLLTRRLAPMFVLSIAIAVFSTVVGYYLAVRWNTSVAGMIAVALGICYCASLVFSPAGGLLVGARARQVRRRAIQEEDWLAALYRLRESGASSSAASVRELLGEHWFSPEAAHRLKRAGLAYPVGDEVHLSARGVEQAQKLVRRHRLLESFYVEQMKKEADDVHERAHRGEHFLDRTGEREIVEALEDVATDPHGRSIPQ
ncbi:MAG TPA: metal ABC transporter permease [Fimbriimonadaceae bacterium]|nr:metal ABC transporter permease [Fimbriimonadaceae bacterium]